MIRNLFFALVLLNLAFAAWTAWYAEPPRSSGPRESGLPLRLAGEVSEPGEGGSAPGAAAVATGAGAVARSVPAIGQRDTAATQGTAAATQGAAATRGVAAMQGVAAVTEGAAATPGAPEVAAIAARVARDDSAAANAPAAAAGVGDVRPAPAGSADSRGRCISIGPFEVAADAEAAAVALEAAGFTPAQRSAEGEIWVGFWVHLDGIPSREEANALLAQLRENGVPDAYLIPGEQDGDIISLGVFNNMTRAGRLDEQVRGIGLVPTILERSRPGTVHWLDIADVDVGDVDLGALGIGQARVGPRPCGADG